TPGGLDHRVVDPRDRVAPEPPLEAIHVQGRVGLGDVVVLDGAVVALGGEEEPLAVLRRLEDERAVVVGPAVIQADVADWGCVLGGPDLGPPDLVLFPDLVAVVLPEEPAGGRDRRDGEGEYRQSRDASPGGGVRPGG